MRVKTKFITLHINNLFFLVVPVIVLTGYLREYVVTFAAITFHEVGHLVSAVLLGKKIHVIRILPIGLNIDIELGTDSRWKHFLIYLSGPVANILLFTIFSVLNSYYYTGSSNMRFFVLVNIYLAIFNLLPVTPLDGGRILNEILTGWVGLFLAAKYIKKISIIICVVLILIGIVQSFSNPYNFSLIFISVFILFSLKQGKTEAALMNIKKIIYRRSRLFKKGVYPARDLVVIKTTYLGETIKNMDFDRFHIIHVLDNDLKLIKIFTEQEVFEAMLKREGDITFEELLESNTD